MKDQLTIFQNATLLSKAFFHFSNISTRQCCVPWPFLNPHWYFKRISSKKVVNCLDKSSLQNLRNQGQNTKKSVVFFEDFLSLSWKQLSHIPFLKMMENEQSIEMKKNIWKYPAKKYLLSLRIFTCMSVSWVTFFRFNFCNSLIMFSFLTTGKINWWQVL